MQRFNFPFLREGIWDASVGSLQYLCVIWFQWHSRGCTVAVLTVSCCSPREGTATHLCQGGFKRFPFQTKDWGLYLYQSPSQKEKKRRWWEPATNSCGAVFMEGIFLKQLLSAGCSLIISLNSDLIFHFKMIVCGWFSQCTNTDHRGIRINSLSLYSIKLSHLVLLN